MSKNIMFNSEGYFDPTAGAALSKIIKRESEAKRMKFAYIASAYNAHGTVTTVENIDRAREYCRIAVDRGYCPMCPHIFLTQILSDDIPAERALGLQLGLKMLKRCEELWVFTRNGYISEGMQGEIAAAENRNMIIRYFDFKDEEG